MDKQTPTDEHMIAILKAKSAVNQAEDRLQDMIESAREAGVTWEIIGTALGVTRQAAQQRFGAWVGHLD